MDLTLLDKLPTHEGNDVEEPDSIHDRLKTWI